MQRPLSSRLFPLALLLLLGGCKPTEPNTAEDAVLARTVAATTTPTEVGTDANLAAAMRGDAPFAARLYAKLPQGENIFFSPASVRMALAMTYAGAKGDTATEMEAALSLDPDAQKNHRGFARALESLEGEATRAEGQPTKPTLRVVNRLWGRRGSAFQPEFLSLLQRSYGAALTPLDFRAETERSRRIINAAIAEETEQKIKDLIPEDGLVPETKLVLTNAVYFKGTWAEAFAAGATKQAPFFVSASNTVQANLMTATHAYPYAEISGAQVVELPYASRRLSMIVVLPSHKDGLEDIEHTLTGAQLGAFTSALRLADVQVSLPRFTITSSFSLGKRLSKMGMPSAFDETKADFSGMDGTRENLHR